MNQRLKDLYSHVSVHATANREHEAAVELLLLVMMADRHISTDEVETIRSISDDSGWETDTFSFDQYIGPASAKVRAALGRARRRCAARRHRRSRRQHGAALGSVQRCARGGRRRPRARRRRGEPAGSDRRPLRLNRRSPWLALSSRHRCRCTRDRHTWPRRTRRAAGWLQAASPRSPCRGPASDRRCDRCGHPRCPS
jgi:hypothetical protein